MEKQNLSKTCVACELQKPLSAFLQVSGPQGSTYGNVCSACRGINAGKAIVIPNIEEEGSSSSTNLKINAKKKLQQDFVATEQAKLKTESDQKEKKKEDLENNDLRERKDDKLNAERKHRSEYLETKKDSFLNYKSKTPQTVTEKTLIDERKIVAATGIVSETLQKQTALEEDRKANSITGLSGIGESYTGPTQTGEIKYQSAEFEKVKKWFGGSAALTTFERQSQSGHKPTAFDTKSLPDAGKEPIHSATQIQPTSGAPVQSNINSSGAPSQLNTQLPNPGPILPSIQKPGVSPMIPNPQIPMQPQPNMPGNPTGDKAQPGAPVPPGSAQTFSPIFTPIQNPGVDPLVKQIQDNFQPNKPSSRRGG